MEETQEIEVVERKTYGWAEWDALLKTEEDNVFTLRVWARNEGEANSKSKKLSNGCRVIKVVKVVSKVGVSQTKLI